MRVTENRAHSISAQAIETPVASRDRKEATPAQDERVHNARQMPALNREAISDLLEKAKRFQQARAALRAIQAADNPALSKEVPGANYRAAKGAELFGENGPSIDDVRQGKIGDCFFLSAVGSVVANDPKAIKDMIRDNGDGTYSVRFYRGNEAVWIHVDGQLPVDSKGQLVYAKGADTDGDDKLEIWVPLLEKAYAKFRDRYNADGAALGYNAIDDGGHSDTVMKALTGRDAERFGKLESADAFGDALDAVNDGRLMTIQTQVDAKDGWKGNHVYTVVKTYEKDGETYVILRNPWGKGEPDGSLPMGDANDGTFAVALDELRDITRRVYSGDSPAMHKPTPWLGLDTMRLVA